MKKNYTRFSKLALGLFFMTGIAVMGNAQCSTTSTPTNDCSYGDAIDNMTINAVLISSGGCAGSSSGYTSYNSQ